MKHHPSIVSLYVLVIVSVALTLIGMATIVVGLPRLLNNLLLFVACFPLLLAAHTAAKEREKKQRIDIPLVGSGLLVAIALIGSLFSETREVSRATFLFVMVLLYLTLWRRGVTRQKSAGAKDEENEETKLVQKTEKEDIPAESEQPASISEEVTIGSLVLNQPVYRRQTGEVFLKLSNLLHIPIKQNENDGSWSPAGQVEAIEDPDEEVEVLHYTNPPNQERLTFVVQSLAQKNLTAVRQYLQTLEPEEILGVLQHVEEKAPKHVQAFLTCLADLDAQMLLSLTTVAPPRHKTIGSLVIHTPIYRRQNGEIFTKLSNSEHVRLKLNAQTHTWVGDGRAEPFDPNEVVQVLHISTVE